MLQKLQSCEPIAMRGQPPVVWDRAEGFQVYDAWGNQWIDWSSAALTANAGHGRREVADAIARQTASGLLTNYCFASEIRSRLVERLATLLPEPLKKILLLTTGSEAVECAIKLCRAHGAKAGGRNKHTIISFDNAVHGRTLGAQQAGGIPAQKDWIVNLDPGFVQVPFPDGYHMPDNNFASFERALRERDVEPREVAGVIIESYQGGSAAFAPVAYIRELRQWCSNHAVLLVCDEVQAGFGRTGTLWGFEHYGIVPDLALFGKGISSSLPIAAVAGRPDVMDLEPAGSMTTTHAGNPVCCAAALASIDLIIKEDLAGNAHRMGAILHEGLCALASHFPQIGNVDGKGLVAGVACVVRGRQEPDANLAWDVVARCVEKGVLMLSPVGPGGGTIKISPPLVIHQTALLEGLNVLEESFAEVVGQSSGLQPAMPVLTPAS
jgi:4-aminobutyrate aminotransferase/diaminobutyrate-pyruvate transaminase/4-aminobutyrate aminotransferase/(S)-3-amino-2-methylpropionate transaminase